MINVGSDYHIREGKLSFLRGEALPPVPEKNTHSQSQCDFRMGYHVAEAQREQHPDWTDEFILRP